MALFGTKRPLLAQSLTRAGAIQRDTTQPTLDLFGGRGRVSVSALGPTPAVEARGTPRHRRPRATGLRPRPCAMAFLPCCRGSGIGRSTRSNVEALGTVSHAGDEQGDAGASHSLVADTPAECHYAQPDTQARIRAAPGGPAITGAAPPAGALTTSKRRPSGDLLGGGVPSLIAWSGGALSKRTTMTAMGSSTPQSAPTNKAQADCGGNANLEPRGRARGSADGRRRAARDANGQKSTVQV